MKQYSGQIVCLGTYMRSIIIVWIKRNEVFGMRLVIVFFILTSLVQSQPAKSKYLVMPSIFSDNMVLQQKSDVPIWGKAEPDQNVKVTASWGQSMKTTVKPDSSWEVRVKTTQAGGPYLISIAVGDTTIVYRNVMLGEVWVCSGQSNMEIPMQGWPPEYPLDSSAEEIAKANYPDIRLFHVARAFAAAPEFNCTGTWSECSPTNVATFSAVGYYFGRRLYRELHVPIGLIMSVWGGTKIQPWISARYLSTMPYYRPIAQEVYKSAGLVAEQKKWIYSHPSIDVSARKPATRWDGLNFDDSRCSDKNYDDSSWKTIRLPVYWQMTPDGHFNGAVWFRKNIQIPRAWIGSTLVLHLGPIDDMDETWVNGTKVGGILEPNYYAYPRVYEVPGKIVSDTTLTIAVRVLDYGGFGGIWGNGVKMEINPKSDSVQAIPLSGNWKWMPVAEYINGTFYSYSPDGEFYLRPELPFPYTYDTPTVLFNGMIAPLIPYGIRGVIWYQGESNSNLPEDYNNYKYLFPLMIKNWRADWGEGDFPFYWVQIAPFNYGGRSKSYVVRNAQRLALSVPNTGMAVTLDVGTVDNIHPPDKLDVGLRLADWALAKTYGRHIVYSGPLYESMKVKNGKAVISFHDVDGGLVFKPREGKTNFIVAGEDSNFVSAEVKIVGKTLVVYSPKVMHPLAVRYAWGNTEQATLFNKAGLPASTFRTDDWPIR